MHMQLTHTNTSWHLIHMHRHSCTHARVFLLSHVFNANRHPSWEANINLCCSSFYIWWRWPQCHRNVILKQSCLRLVSWDYGRYCHINPVRITEEVIKVYPISGTWREMPSDTNMHAQMFALATCTQNQNDLLWSVIPRLIQVGWKIVMKSRIGTKDKQTKKGSDR